MNELQTLADFKKRRAFSLTIWNEVLNVKKKMIVVNPKGEFSVHHIGQ